MFCPNCSKQAGADEKFCRSCGLKLDAVTRFVADQFPSEEFAALQRRRLMIEKLGFASLSFAGAIGVMLLLFVVGLSKLILFGPAALVWSGVIALSALLVLSAGLIGYSKLFMPFEKLRSPVTPPDGSSSIPATGKLLQDPFFEPVPSVTEHSTDLLPTRDKTDQS